jgi:hypothetical protein
MGPSRPRRLQQATAVELGQSPFLNIVSNDRVRDTLRFTSSSKAAAQGSKRLENTD